MMLVSFDNNTTDATCGIGAAYPSGAPGKIPVLVGFMWLDLYFTK